MNISFQSLYNGPALSKPAFGGNEAKTDVKSGSFTQNIVSKSKANLEELRKDDEKRYNALGAFLGISVLAGLGLALIYRDKVTNLFNIKKRRNIAKQMDVAAKRPHGGPEIDWSKGRRAIYESWEEYIQGIKDRRSQNHILAKEYKELFRNNAEQLDLWEKLADARNAGRRRRLFR